MTDKTEIREQFDLSAAGLHDGFATLPDGYSVHDLEKFEPAPRRARADHKFREVETLAEYLIRYGNQDSVAFADWRARTIRAVIDYHEPDGAPAFGEHRASFIAQRTSAWEAWRGVHDKPMAQVAFGRFLEENAHLILEPDAASVVEVCMALDAVKRVSFRSSIRLSDGFRQIEYTEDNDTKGGVRVPENLVINVPVFEGQEPQRIPVRLRYRIDEGKLSLWVTIDHLDDIEREAFEKCIDALAHDGPADLKIYRAIL